MKATWAVIAAVVLALGVGAWKLAGPGEVEAPALSSTTGAEGAAVPLLPAPAVAGGAAATGAGAALPVPPSPQEERGRLLVHSLVQAHGAGDQAKVDALEASLRAEAWESVAARRYAVQSGFMLVRKADGVQGEERMRLLDRARRLLSRGVWLDETFDAQGLPTPERLRLLEVLRGLNQQVMTWRPGLQGITRAYKVPQGKSPVQVVSDEKLRVGHNAILVWNKRGVLDPRRLVAGETLMLPTGELHLEVSIARRMLVVWLDDVWVKEFRVGVGKPSTPTPTGLFRVVKKHENPPWYPPQGGIIPAGDPRNELGSVWIHIANEQHPEGYGIHGTNRPDTVGSECSQGCVRLANEQASEMFWWVRTASAGGEATRVLIR